MSDGSGAVVEVEAWIRHLVPRFLANRQKDIEALAAAIRSDDIEAIRIIGHNLKGGAGGYGFAVLAEIGGRLEAAGEAGSLETAAACLRELAEHVRTIQVVYR
jgi:HPt (histidine-containing phosphotransfer) domain-containing protein